MKKPASQNEAKYFLKEHYLSSFACNYFFREITLDLSKLSIRYCPLKHLPEIRVDYMEIFQKWYSFTFINNSEIFYK